MRSSFIAALFSIAVIYTGCARQQSNDAFVVDQTFVHKYGVAVPSDYWSSSGEHGSVISTMGDGVVISRTYSAGLLDGETTYTYPHSSQIQKKEIYNQGILVKEGEFYFDGAPRSETVFEPLHSFKTLSLWYLSGTPKSIEQYEGELLVKGDYFTSFNQHDAAVENYAGTRLVRDDYGQLLATDQIKNGQLVLRTSYHPNGSPKEMTPFNNGLVEGVKKTFHPAGEPNTLEEWIAGNQQGKSYIYQHGEKFAEVPFDRGLKNGVERRFRDGKDVVQEISWNDGQLHGPTTTYVGDTSKTDWYYQGNLMTKTDYDFMINKPVVR